MIDNRIDAIHQRTKQEINQAVETAINTHGTSNAGVSAGTLNIINNIALSKCEKAKAEITQEWTRILRGGKSISEELGMLGEFKGAMKALAELKRLKSETSMKKQKMQESWNKLVTHDPDVTLDPNLPNPFEREGGSDYES
jgi:hypothetical protein